MKAVIVRESGGPEVLEVADVERPKPSAGQVLIKVAAASVNRPDILQRMGQYPPPKGESEILGLEIAGTVDSAGNDVVGILPGERVMALVGGGGYAEYATAHSGHVMRIPDGMTFEQAACVCETYITAYLNLFLIARLTDGESVLLHGGGGGVNTAALQLVKIMTPRSRILVTASPGKLERVKELGADRVINYENEDFAKAALDYTEQRGVDVVLDHIGASYFTSNLKALATGGRLAVIAAMGGREAALDLARLMVKRQMVFGSVLRPRPIAEKAAIVAKFNQVVVPLFADGRISPVIHQVYPLDKAADAHRTMEASKHFGKLVLRVE